jgi:hypothetical protein
MVAAKGYAFIIEKVRRLNHSVVTEGGIQSHRKIKCFCVGGEAAWLECSINSWSGRNGTLRHNTFYSKVDVVKIFPQQLVLVLVAGTGSKIAVQSILLMEHPDGHTHDLHIHGHVGGKSARDVVVTNRTINTFEESEDVVIVLLKIELTHCGGVCAILRVVADRQRDVARWCQITAFRRHIVDAWYVQITARCGWAVDGKRRIPIVKP